MSDELETAKRNLIGMSLEKAKDLLGRSGWILRCVKRDSKAMVVTQNIMPNRINVEATNGVITDVKSTG